MYFGNFQRPTTRCEERRMAVSPLKDFFWCSAPRGSRSRGHALFQILHPCGGRDGLGRPGRILGGPAIAAPTPDAQRNESRKPRLLLIAFFRHPILRDSCKASSVHRLRVSSHSCSHIGRAWSGDLQRTNLRSSIV